MSAMEINNMFKRSRLSALPPTLAGCDRQGLVARWLLDGGLTDQVSGRALTRAGTWNTTSYNMVWDIELRQFVPVFTGSNYYTFNPAAHSGHAAFPSGAAAGTIMCWAKMRSADSAMFFIFGGATTGTWRYIGHYSDSLRASDGLSDALAGINARSDGTWHHIAKKYNGSAFLVYVDGIVQAIVSKTLTTGATLGAIGGQTSGSHTGFMSDCRVYSEALSAARIEAIATGRA